MKKLALLLLFAGNVECFCQEHGFPFGSITYEDLDMKAYKRDTAAIAVVLEEFGEAYIDNANDNNLLFEYHTRIKILKKEGLATANFEIPLQRGKSSGAGEKVRSVRASSFNHTTGITEDKMDPKKVYTENLNQYWDLKKFTIPNAQVGSIIEVLYVVESPFVFNFHPWEFQSDIPKIHSEYWATIPGNYVYNITLKGFLKLQKNENELVKECFTPGGSAKADCARFKYGMSNIPALVEEDHMLAKSNYISSINFELAEIKRFDGVVQKYTEEWKDAERKLRLDEDFGVQLKKGKDIFDDHIEQLIAGETDEVSKARKIFDFIKFRYVWNGFQGKYAESGVKKSFENKKGNTADINLALIASLRNAGLNVEPVILSTRKNGLPIELHPVLSDFNYVIAKVNIGDKYYLLDATDDFTAFGMLPVHCINGKGRVLGEKESYWVDLKATDKDKQIVMYNLKVDKDGVARGTIQRTYIGYGALEARKVVNGFSTEKEYFDNKKKKSGNVEITGELLTNLNDLSKPLVESYNVSFPMFDDLNATHLLFEPFFNAERRTNPFKSNNRLYPVDFGTPIDETLVLNLEYPENFTITDLPEKIALSLPNSGGRYIYELQNLGNKLTMNSSLVIIRTIYSSQEYHYLKELFNRVVSAQEVQVVFEKK